MINNKKGFTLIELMIVVAIIGILAAIAIPNFMKFQCRAKQSEAKVLLSGLYTAEIAYFGEFNRYKLTGAEVGFTPASTPKVYKTTKITIVSASLDFSATTSGAPAGNGVIETWRVTNLDRQPTLVGSNACN